jgi:hypothetical protein
MYCLRSNFIELYPEFYVTIATRDILIQNQSRIVNTNCDMDDKFSFFERRLVNNLINYTKNSHIEGIIKLNNLGIRYNDCLYYAALAKNKEIITLLVYKYDYPITIQIINCLIRDKDLCGIDIIYYMIETAEIYDKVCSKSNNINLQIE